MTFSIGVARVRCGHWHSVWLVAPSKWCTSLLPDTTWIVMASSSEHLPAKLMSSSLPEPWPTKWLQLCAKSTIRCPNRVGSFQWDRAPMVEDIITIPTRLFGDVTESSQSISTFPDAHQPLKLFSTESCSSKRRSSAWRRCRCGTESKLTFRMKH